MENILSMLKVVNIVVTVLVAMYAWIALKNRHTSILFTIMVSLFCASTVFFFPEGEINDWLKHIPFYIGQIVFYFFVKSMYTQPAEIGGRKRVMGGGTSALMVASATESGGWFSHATAHGLQHIIALPLFVLVTTGIKVMTSEREDTTLQSVTNYLLLAGWGLTMIHLGEFLIESQGLLPALEGDPIELIEFVWFYIAFGMFFLALKGYKDKSKIGNQTV